jgi:hypothetical protein
MERREKVRKKTTWPTFYVILHPTRPQVITELSSGGADLS